MLTEKLLFNVIDKAFEDDINIDVFPTVYHPLKQTAIRIGNCESKLSPHSDGTIKEFNAKLRIEVLDKIGVDEKRGYLESLETVFEILLRLTKVLINNAGFEDAYCTLTIDECYRTFAKENGSPYAIAFMLVTINPL